MASLLDLPPELLDSVLEYLPVTDQRAVTLTSKRLHEIGAHTLYKHIKFYDRVPGDKHPVTLLLRTFIENRQLGGLVQSLRLARYQFAFSDSPYVPTPAIPTDDLDLEKVGQLIQEFRVPHADYWKTQAEMNGVDAIVTLLLTFLPNLRELYLFGDFAIEHHILGATLLWDLRGGTIGNLPMRHTLQRVNIETCNGYSGWIKSPEDTNKATALALFYLPNLEWLHVEMDSLEDNEDALEWPLDHPPTHLQLQVLMISQVRGWEARAVFRACSQLKRLVWHISLPNRIEDKFSPISLDLEDVNLALRPLRGGTLEHLNVNVAYDEERGDSSVRLPPITGSLKVDHLANVTSFSVSWPLVMGFSLDSFNLNRLKKALPRNIVHLTLTDALCESELWEWDQDSMHIALSRFLMKYEQYTPDLHLIELFITRLRDLGGIWNEIDGVYEEVWTEDITPCLEHLGRQYGIHIVVNTGYEESDDESVDDDSSASTSSGDISESD